MDRNALQNELNKAVSGAVLEKSRFGRTAEECLWVDSKKVAEIASFLGAEENGAHWLENLSVMQMDDALVLTYFVRARDSATPVILRSSLSITKDGAAVAATTVRDAWPMARPYEDEAAELFGIHFQPGGARPDPAHWNGFPLRKGYVFGK